MANAYFYSNTAQPTTLSGSISAGATTITVAATTGFPGSFPYVVALDYGAGTEELAKVTAAAALNLTVERGFSGTSAQSHSLGAVVRHVYHAGDATDFRTHEAAASDVHGVTGALVGATQSQTLTNKTLTAPTITNGAYSSGGSMAGTFTGTPTFSGAVVLSGTPSISAGAALSGTFSGTPTFSGAVTLSGGGTQSGTWAGTPTFSGNHTHTGEIILSNLLRGSRTTNADSMYEARVTGDAVARWFTQSDGDMFWGNGTDPVDVKLYRSAADVLKTDDSLEVGTGLTVGSTTWTTYTPTVGNGGTATWTTRTGYYYKLGKMVFVVVYLAINAAGSGAGNVTIEMPSSVDRTTRQMLAFHAEGLTASYNGTGSVVFFTSGSGAVADRTRTFDGQNITGAQLAASGTITVQGWYREA